MNTKYYLGIGLVLVCLVFSQSCKKGCTNPTAFNYVRSAKVDDGSCLYCDSVLSAGSTSSVGIEDENSTSIHAFQEVAFLVVTSNFIAYNGNGCQLLGHTNNNNNTGCVSTYYTGLLENQTSNTLTFSGTVEIESFQDSTTFTFFNVSNVTVAPNSTTTFNIGPGGCQQQFAGFEVQVPSAVFFYR